jgi:hypothetical protein
MSNNNPDKPASLFSYSGWIRRGRGPWRLLCRGASEQAVLRELLRYEGWNKLVRRGDADPNQEQV